MHPDWVRSIQKQCEAAGVAFYFKQWGKWKPVYHEKNTVNMKKVGTKAAGNLLDGKQYLEIPEN
jgi:protein gp37